MESLQLTQVALFILVVVPVRLVMTRIRRPLLHGVGRASRGAVKLAAVVSDVVAALVYGAFVLAAFPFEYEAELAAHYFEQALDEVAVFALVVALVELISLLSVRRTAIEMDGWPEPAPGNAVRP